MSLENDVNNFLNTPSTNFDHTMIDFFIRLEERFNNTQNMKKEFERSGATTVDGFRDVMQSFIRGATVEEQYGYTSIEYSINAAQNYDVLFAKKDDIMVSIFVNNVWQTKCSNIEAAVPFFDNRTFLAYWLRYCGTELTLETLGTHFKIVRPFNI
jgi:hypothetical protein